MKKILSGILAVSILLGMGTGVMAKDESKEIEKANALVEDTNNKIIDEIEKAQEKANKLQEKYLEDVGRMNEKNAKTSSVVINYSKDSNLPERCNPDIVCDEFVDTDMLYEEYAELTSKYEKHLDQIINNVFNKTKKMSEHTISKVNKLEDITAECYWVKVTFAHRTVWIDPIHVVGEY